MPGITLARIDILDVILVARQYGDGYGVFLSQLAFPEVPSAGEDRDFLSTRHESIQVRISSRGLRVKTVTGIKKTAQLLDIVAIVIAKIRTRQAGKIRFRP